MKERSEEFAPVVIPTLCRYNHLKSCLTSLSQCKYAKETLVYIALDYPSKEGHFEGYQKIKEYLPTVTGFKEVIVIEREKNYGAVNNMNSIIDYAFKSHNRLIFSEDDNVFAHGFLEFINKALLKYANDEQVVSVSGYCYPIDLRKYTNNVFVAPNFSAWGVGYWKGKYYDNWRNYVSRNYARQILCSINKSMMVFKNNPRILARLITMFWHGKLHTDTMIVASEIVNGKYSLFPKDSFVQNHGFDGSGENCWHQELEELFSNQALSNNIDISLDNIPVTKSSMVDEVLYNYFNPSLNRTVLTLLAYFVLRIAILFNIKNLK